MQLNLQYSKEATDIIKKENNDKKQKIMTLKERLHA
jgi:hypothetical protein